MALEASDKRTEEDARTVVPVENIPVSTDDKRNGVEDHQREIEQRKRLRAIEWLKSDCPMMSVTDRAWIAPLLVRYAENLRTT